MQNSRTLERSKSFTNVRFRTRAVALVIATMMGAWGCGGGTGQSSQSGGFNPTPAITTISPNSGAAGGAAFTLTIDGTNFVAGSMVNFGSSSPATTFVSPTQLTAAVPAGSIVSTGTTAVVVINPRPGGGTSNPVSFTITSGTNPVPTISSFYPSCVPAGELFIDSIDNQLTVSGLNFVASSVVRWNGADLPTTLDSNSLGKILTAQVQASDIAAAGAATVTVFNPSPGGGSSNSLKFSITPGGVAPQSISVDSAGNFAYVANAGCSGGVVGYVSMYTVNSTTGALASIGPAASSLDYSAASVTVDPFGKFAYVANVGDDFSSDGSVVSYTIDATTGVLTSTGAISGNCPGLCVPVSVAVHPSGKFAYVPYGASDPNAVAIYAIDATTGVLTSAGTIPVQGYAMSVALHPSGKFAYLAAASGTSSAGSVSMYTINATTGFLISTGTIGAGSISAQPAPTLMTVDPNGKFAYVVNIASNDVSMYTVDAATGTLTSIGTIAAGKSPLSIAVDPAGGFAYVVNYSSNDVSMYTIDAATGALSSMGTIATESAPTSIAIHPSGKFAYVTNSNSNSVSIYGIDTATGVLTLIGNTGT